MSEWGWVAVSRQSGDPANPGCREGLRVSRVYEGRLL